LEPTKLVFPAGPALGHTYKKNPAPGKPVSYEKNGLKFQPWRKDINLDNKTRLSYPEDYCLL
jgi:hypothetical protein